MATINFHAITSKGSIHTVTIRGHSPSGLNLYNLYYSRKDQDQDEYHIALHEVAMALLILSNISFRSQLSISLIKTKKTTKSETTSVPSPVEPPWTALLSRSAQETCPCIACLGELPAGLAS
jgi:hypothetical protein